MSTSDDKALIIGMTAIHARYKKERQDIEFAKGLAEATLKKKRRVSETQLVAMIIEKLRKKELPGTEYLASYATDYLRAAGLGKKDWFNGTLTYSRRRLRRKPLSVRDPGLRLNDDTAPVNDDVSRSDAEIDIDRISYATEFRRLGGVTQVIPPQQDHLIHDRLTHSMKVAHVAAALARFVVAEAKKKRNRQRLKGISNRSLATWVDPNYCYAAGLAHDIGHPPFGHAGEQALQNLLSPEQSKEGGARPPRQVCSRDRLKETLNL